MSILWINACCRPESRTRKLSEYLLERLPGEVTEVSLEEEKIAPMDYTALCERERLLAEGRVEEPAFRFARQFKEADQIVISAPYWDLSFPAALKAYLEAINVCGVTFSYDEQGVPRSLCRAKRMIYVTTAGGPVFSDEPGYGYVRMLCQGFFGIPETVRFKAEGLDIAGADVEAILAGCRAEMDRWLAEEERKP